MQINKQNNETSINQFDQTKLSNNNKDKVSPKAKLHTGNV